MRTVWTGLVETIGELVIAESMVSQASEIRAPEFRQHASLSE